MRTPLGLSLLMLVTSACVLPASDEELELGEQESALTLKVPPQLQLPKNPILPGLDKPLFTINLAEAYCRQHPAESSAHFVVPRGPLLPLPDEPSGHADCEDVPGTHGVWYGAPAFPGVVSGLCRYEWEGSTAPDYFAILFSAAREPFTLSYRIMADCRQVQPTCSSVASCAAATPALRPDPALIASSLTPETLPCPACRGTVASRRMVAVLSPEFAGHSLVTAEVIKDGRRYSTVFKPSGSQVDSYEIPDDFPDTTSVEFKQFLSAGAVPSP